MKVVLATGGFDPLHSGHIAYLEAARRLGDVLVVGVNSDKWLAYKKGKFFMTWNERATVIQALRCVDHVIKFDDSDGTALDAITYTQRFYIDNEIIFANGGDRTKDNIPEMKHPYEKLQFAFGVGGEDKKNSSSWILNDWKK